MDGMILILIIGLWIINKRRERMMQSERMKAQMAQLAMEAKLRVEERRIRLEGAAAVEREKEEEGTLPVCTLG